MIESINYQLRRIIKTRGHLPNDDALIKLLYLGCKDIGRVGAPRGRASGKGHGSGGNGYAWKSPSTSSTSCSPAGSTRPNITKRSGPYTENLTGPSTFFFGHDQQGSTRLLTDLRGNVTATYSYSPYGQTVSRTGTVDTPLRYDGQYLDAETGCYYLQARYYDPAIAQFLTRDPLEAITGQAYTYADGDPINLADPTGLINGPQPVKRNAKIAFSYLVEAGFSENGAAALVGNFMYESAKGSQPRCNLEGGVDPTCGTWSWNAHGIAQWTNGRWGNYTGKYVAAQQAGWIPPSNPRALESQLAFVVWELENNPRYGALAATLKHPGTRSLDELTTQVFKEYEAPAEYDPEMHRSDAWLERHTSLGMSTAKLRSPILAK